LLEFLANNLNGNLTKAFEVVMQFQALLDLRKESYYGILIRMLMQDLRLKKPKILKDLEISKNKSLSEMEKIKLSVIIDIDATDLEIAEKATQVLFDMYHGMHPLYEPLSKGQTDCITSLLPSYFSSRFFLQRDSQSIDFDKVLPLQLSGIAHHTFTHDLENVYHLVETLHKLLCLLVYHNIVLPRESFPCASVKLLSDTSSKNNESTSSSQTDHTLNTQPVHI